MKRRLTYTWLAACAALAPLAAHAWEPTKTVEFIVPAGMTNSTVLVGSQACAARGAAANAAQAASEAYVNLRFMVFLLR